EGAEIVEQLAVARVVGRVPGHGEFEKLRHALAGDQVRRFVHRGARVVNVPEATHVAVRFETLEGDAVFLQAARASQARGAGADEGDLLFGGDGHSKSAGLTQGCNGSGLASPCAMPP